MNKKLIYLPLVFAMLIVMVAGIGYAACTFVTPATGGIAQGGTQNFNVSCATLTGGYNCSVTATSTLSGESKSLLLLNNTNNAIPASMAANITQSTLTWKDSADVVLAGTCTNVTTTEAITSATVSVDNTVPVVSGCTLGGTTSTNRTVTSSSATVACTVYNATSCNVYWGSSKSVSSDTSTTDCSYTSTSSFAAAGTSVSCSVKQIGDKAAPWYYTCTDGTNSTMSTVYSVKQDGASGTGPGSVGGGSSTTTTITMPNLSILKNKTVMLLLMGLVVVVILVIVAFVFGKKK